MLSKTQKQVNQKFMTHFHLWERDLLWMASRYPAWRNKARQLGFTDQKIDQPWTFQDAGKLIQYMEIPDGRTQDN